MPVKINTQTLQISQNKLLNIARKIQMDKIEGTCAHSVFFSFRFLLIEAQVSPNTVIMN